MVSVHHELIEVKACFVFSFFLFSFSVFHFRFFIFGFSFSVFHFRFFIFGFSFSVFHFRFFAFWEEGTGMRRKGEKVKREREKRGTYIWRRDIEQPSDVGRKISSQDRKCVAWQFAQIVGL
jgi:hypothetical protein